ncbi:alpha/beta fold hydrolase [Salinibacterium sp. NK8237]|uniref:alpha/beta fold hydrolase n=1 Tax=Salinibacterium sp. NK8237 TaxID=2792038 RepID=UPI0018CED8FA|nr:alpha/beta hydrolase [Salinibacterium sp. NK8237]MBH0130305.1 alpha/beta hydrolase [Salinibacterium sp. NK8237]
MPSYVGSDETTLHYDVVGCNGEPIILLAGGAARHPSYLGDLAGLSKSRQLIVAHLRGVGRSRMPVAEEHGSYWNQADDIERLRMHLGLDRVVVVAHSAGTRLAIAYAAQFTKSLSRMVLITPPATYLVGEASDVEVLSQKRRGDLVFESAFAALAAGPRVTDDAGYNAWQQQTAPAGYAQWGAKEQAHAQIGNWSLAAAKAYFSFSPPTNFALRLEDISAPVLVLAGAEDSLTGLAPVVALADLFPSGVAEVIERSGHYPWVEQPQAFRRAIDAFLED